MQIRSATTGDAFALADLYIQSAEHHVSLDPVFYHVPDHALVLDRFADRLVRTSETTSAIFVAQDRGAIAGMLAAQVGDLPAASSMVAPQRPMTIEMAVDNHYRGRGIGSQLLSRAEQWAADMDVDVLLLDVHSRNERARSLYLRQGFVDQGSLLIKRRT